MQLRPLAFALASALLATTASCETRVSLGTPCRSTAECNDGLLCSFGRCRAGCERQTDCSGAQLCIQETGQHAVCTLVDDSCNECSAGLVCNVSVCAAPCTATSCVSGSSCRMDPTSMSDICVRDDLADARMDTGRDAYIPTDAPVDQCMLGLPAASSGMTLADVFGLGGTFTVGMVPQVEIIDDPPGPTLIPYSEPLALGLNGSTAWVASARDNGTATTDQSHDRLLWEVMDIFGAAPSAVDIATPAFDALNDVYAADVHLGRDGLSALFVRNNPDAVPELFWRLDGSPPTGRSIRDDTMHQFPGGAALFGGLMPDTMMDDSAIALAVQDDDAVQTATTLFVIPGSLQMGTGTNISLGGAWPTPLPLFGTEGALAALNTSTGRVQVLRLDNGSRDFPMTWAWGEEMHARAIDITNVPGMPGHFVLASLQEFGGVSCDHVLLTHLVCASSASCEIRGRFQVPMESWATDVLITPVPNGFALVTQTDVAHVTWLDRGLQVVGARQQLFTHTLSTAPTFGLRHLAIASSAEGFVALGLFRNDAEGHSNEARYARSGFVVVR